MRPNIWAVKEAARIEDVARDHGGFRTVGDGRLLGHCVDPRHEDRTPSMTVYVDEQRFKCYGCGEHGDVIDLVKLAEGCEFFEAMLLLAQRYGVELPGRPDSWHRKQERQRPIRDAIGKARFDHLRRRLFRLYFKDALLSIEDPAEREAEYEILWDSTEHLTRMVLRGLGERGKP